MGTPEAKLTPPKSAQEEVHEQLDQLERQQRSDREFFQSYIEEWAQIQLRSAILDVQHQSWQQVDEIQFISDHNLRSQMLQLLRLIQLGSRREERLRSLTGKFSDLLAKLVAASRPTTPGGTLEVLLRSPSTKASIALTNSTLYEDMRKTEEAILSLLKITKM